MRVLIRVGWAPAGGAAHPCLHVAIEARLGARPAAHVHPLPLVAVNRIASTESTPEAVHRRIECTRATPQAGLQMRTVQKTTSSGNESHHRLTRRWSCPTPQFEGPHPIRHNSGIQGAGGVIAHSQWVSPNEASIVPELEGPLRSQKNTNDTAHLNIVTSSNCAGGATGVAVVARSVPPAPSQAVKPVRGPRADIRAMVGNTTAPVFRARNNYDSPLAVASSAHGLTSAVLNQGDQGENLIPPSLILVPDIPDIPEVPWVPSGA